MLFLNEAFFIINNNYDIQVTYKICIMQSGTTAN